MYNNKVRTNTTALVHSEVYGIFILTAREVIFHRKNHLLLKLHKKKSKNQIIRSMRRIKKTEVLVFIEKILYLNVKLLSVFYTNEKLSQ